MTRTRIPLAALMAALLAGCGGGPTHSPAAGGDGGPAVATAPRPAPPVPVLHRADELEIAAHPRDLKYPALAFDPPAPESLRTVLPNGVPVYIQEDHEAPAVDITILVRTGSVWEPKEKAGLADAVGTLMRTGGTQTLDPAALDETLDFMAADVSTDIGQTQGQAHLFCLKKDAAEGLRLFFDVLRNPRFDEERFRLYKEQVLDGLKSRNDSTNAIEDREWALAIYGDCPQNHWTTKKSLESITRQDLFDFHQSFFTPKNLMIAVSGDFDRGRMLEDLAKAMEGWRESGSATGPVPVPAHTPKPGVYTFHKEKVNQARVTLGHLGIDHKNPDKYALSVLNYILGGGTFLSRLMVKIRTDEGLAYSVGSQINPTPYYPGTFEISFQTKSESTAYGIALALDEVRKFQKEMVSEKELDDARNFFVESFPRRFASKHDVVKRFADDEYIGREKDYHKNWRANMLKVTREDIQRVAQKYLMPEKMVFVVVGNINDVRKGDGKHPPKLEDAGPVQELPLLDPYTLERIAPGTPETPGDGGGEK